MFFAVSKFCSNAVGRDSSVGIATGYGMDGTGIESRWRRDFPHPSRLALKHTQPSIQYLPERGVNHQPPSSAEVKERVELYLCSPLGLHGHFQDDVYYLTLPFSLHLCYTVARFFQVFVIFTVCFISASYLSYACLFLCS